MTIKFRKDSEEISLPKAVAEHEPEMSELDMRLVLTVALRGGIEEDDLDGLAKTFGVSRTDMDISVSYLRGAGILAPKGRRTKTARASKGEEKAAEDKKAVTPKTRGPEDAPSYTSDEIKKVFKEHAELALLLNACQNTVGKVFNSVEANTVLVMRDYLCLEPEYILALMAYCKEKGKTSLKYMERMAYTLTDKGIDSYAALEDYLRRKDKFESSEEFLRRMFGIGDRALTAKEHSAFTSWSIDWELDTELIRKAYEMTVNAIGKPSVPYANKILEKWHSAGYEKPEDVPEPESPQGGSGEGSFGTDEFFEAALKRSYNRKMKGGGEDQLQP